MKFTMMIPVFDRIENCGKRRKCWSPAFSPFPRMFLKALSRDIKSLYCVVDRVNSSKANRHLDPPL